MLNPTPLTHRPENWLRLGLLAALLAACAGPSPTPAPTVTDEARPRLATPTPPPPATPTLAVTATPSPTPVRTTFTLALPVAPGSLDPAQATDEAALLITRHLYEGLTRFEPGTTRAAPALAEAWRVSEDGLTWTFRLRAAAFSDGAPLTAEAVAANFQRWLTRTPPGGYVFFRQMFGGFLGQADETGAPLGNLAAVSVTVASEVALTLVTPDAALPNTLAMPAFAIVNPTAWEAAGFGAPGAGSAGTGPFVLERWAPGIVTLARHPGYWGAPAQPEKLTFKTIEDAVQRLTALQVGEVDGIAGLEASRLDTLQGWPVRVDYDPPLEVLYLGFNQARTPWGNVDCRRAVALAVDRARYAEAFFPGDGAPAEAMLPPGLLTAEAPPAPARDLTQAAQLWEACVRAERQAGAALPESIQLFVPPIPRSYLPDPAGLGAALQADLAAAGISVTVAAPDWQTEWLPLVQAGRADLFVLGWYAANGDPDGYLCPLFCGQNAAFNTDSKGLPLPPDEALAALLRQARSTTDPAARATLYAQAQTRIAEALPALPLAYRQGAWAFRDDVQGNVPSPIESVFFELRVVAAP